MDDLEEGKSYLVKVNNQLRIATFNGFGANKGWGGQDWSGDSGFSTDSWMHDDVQWYLPLNKLAVTADGDTKQVQFIGLNQA